MKTKLLILLLLVLNVVFYEARIKRENDVAWWSHQTDLMERKYDRCVGYFQ